MEMKMEPNEAISAHFHGDAGDGAGDALDDLITSKITALDEKNRCAVEAISGLQRQIDEDSARRGHLLTIREKRKIGTSIISTLEEILTEHILMSIQKPIFNVNAGLSTDYSPVEPEITTTIIKDDQPSHMQILKSAAARAMQGSALDPSFDPDPDPVETAPVPAPSLEDAEALRVDAALEAKENEDEQVAFYRQPVEDDREAANAGDKKAAAHAAIMGKSKASERAKVWRRLMQAAGKAPEGTCSRMSIAQNCAISMRKLDDCIEAFVSMGNLEMIPALDPTWIKFKILRR